MNSLRKTIVSLVILMTSLMGSAQINESTDTTKQLMLVIKTDGAEFYGYVLSDDGREILLETKTIGKIYIAKGDIQKISPASDDDGEVIKRGAYTDYRNAGAFTTRYYFTTNALPVKKGENYAMLNLYGPEVHFAVSDNLSVGVMSTWIGSPLGIAAKYSFDSETDVHYSVGTIVGTSGYLFQGRGYGGLHWGTVTKGDRKANISFTAGFGYAGMINPDQWDFGSYGRRFDVQHADGDYDYNFEYAAQDRLEQEYGSLALTKNGPKKAAVFSVAGITPVGQKASFIFDALVFVNTGYKRVVRRSFTIDDVTYDTYGSYPDYQSGTITADGNVTEYGLEKDGTNATVILMPGMRFNRSHNKAFQVVLAGVITKIDGDVYSFPVPMISWLRKF